MHKRGMVHGDFRNVNIVFDDTGHRHIIDFDLARNENDVYPNVYVTSHPERHYCARPGNEMLKIHDKHALFYILCYLFPCVSSLKLVDEELNTWMDLLQKSSSS